MSKLVRFLVLWPKRTQHFLKRKLHRSQLTHPVRTLLNAVLKVHKQWKASIILHSDPCSPITSPSCGTVTEWEQEINASTKNWQCNLKASESAVLLQGAWRSITAEVHGTISYLMKALHESTVEILNVWEYLAINSVYPQGFQLQVHM